MQHLRSQKGVISISLIGAIIIIIAAIAGLSAFSTRSRSVEDTKDAQADAMMVSDGATPDDAMMQDGDSMEQRYMGAVLAGTSAPLLDFNKADYDAAVRSGKLVVLYFYANWCPICKVEFPKAQAAFNALDTDQVIGFRVNYKDNETDKDEEALARQFGVPYQHTKVFLKDGKQVLKAPDQWDAARYTAEIQKALTQ